MITLTEGNIQITFPDDVQARKFDDATTHGLLNCMKAVDFIVELKDRFLFIEFKDPGHPGASVQDRQAFLQQFLSGEIDEKLKYKYRDSFLYEWASGRANKPIYYFVLISLETLDDALLLARTDALKKKIPLRGPNSGAWKKTFISGCAVFNMKAWNDNLREYPVSRIN